MDEVIVQFGVAGIGFIGVVVGAAVAAAGAWLSERRSRKTNAAYLAIRVACVLDEFIEGCADVVFDDGTIDGQPAGADGSYETQTTQPIFAPMSVDVEWRSIETGLADQILSLPGEVNRINRCIDDVAYHASPPYDDVIEERRYRYAVLGHKAWILALSLRASAGLPGRKYSEHWDPSELFLDKMSEIEKTRQDHRAQRQTEWPFSVEE